MNEQKKYGWFSRRILDVIAWWLNRHGWMVASQYVYDRLLRDSHDLQYARELLARQKEAQG